MIDNYSIKNFKIHKEINSIDLKGLTILTGVNNSGKSSIIQSIRLLSKINRESYNFTRLPLKEISELGSYARVLNKDVSTRESIIYTFSLDVVNLKFCNITLEFKSAYNYEQSYIDMVDEIVLDNMDVYFQNDKGVFNYNYEINIESNKGLTYDLFKVDLENSIKEKIESDVIIRGLFIQVMPNEFNECYIDLMNISAQLSKISEQKIKYIPAFRNTDNSVLAKILDTNKENLLFDGKSTIWGAFEEWTSKLLDSQFRIKVEDNKPKIVSIQEGIEFDLTQIGFGNSQVLPIIALILLAKKDDLIIIENPEVHLHPRWKTNLVELFYYAVSNGINILVETQSMEIINRVRLKVKKDISLNNETSLYFFEKNRFSSNVNKIDIDENGNLDYWPNDFVDKITVNDSIELL